jgi:hypothetical protein
MLKEIILFFNFTFQSFGNVRSEIDEEMKRIDIEGVSYYFKYQPDFECLWKETGCSNFCIEKRNTKGDCGESCCQLREGTIGPPKCPPKSNPIFQGSDVCVMVTPPIDKCPDGYEINALSEKECIKLDQGHFFR